MNAFILGLKHDIEQLKDGRVNLTLKASNQEIIIDRLKSDVVRLKTETDAVRVEKKQCEDQIRKCHQKEVTLTAERDTLKRELELVREASKREFELLKESKAETAQLRTLLDCERSKRQKMRSSYRKLNESLNGQDETTADVRMALEQLREGLME